MDIVYVIGKGSKYDNLELRMSLRSIERFGKNVGKVIVAGIPPLWLSDSVIKVPIEDKYVYKHSNILMCIEKVVDLGLVEGEFLYSSDDHFYCREVDFEKYPYYIKGELRDSVSRIDPYYNYHKSLYDTRKLCEKHGLPTKNWSQHCNTHMHADVVKQIRAIIHESYLLPFGVEPTSIIMNGWVNQPNAPKSTYRKDMKITSAESIVDMWSKIGVMDCFSTSNSAFSCRAVMDFFRNEFGTRSRFENS